MLANDAPFTVKGVKRLTFLRGQARKKLLATQDWVVKHYHINTYDKIIVCVAHISGYGV